MGKLCEITVNGERFHARPGDLLLDAAQIRGIDIPHHCRSGHCGSCIVRLLDGTTIGGIGAEPGTIHACQARILSDVSVAFSDMPDPRTYRARVAAIKDLTEDVVEVTLAPSRQIPYLPGQHLRVEFAGFPERAYCPTLRLDNPEKDGTLRFHVKRIDQGRVSSRLGSDIKLGHRVRLRGPYGSAHFRRAMPNRLVLVAGGIGFALIWSIVDAALAESDVRPIAIVIGVRSLDSLYMTNALELLATCRNVTATIASQEPQNVTSVIRTGMASEFIPALTPDDIVYAAGPSGLVDVVEQRAQEVGAAVHAEPFLPNGPQEPRLFHRLVARRRAKAIEPSMSPLELPGPEQPSLRSVLNDLQKTEPSFNFTAARDQHP